MMPSSIRRKPSRSATISDTAAAPAPSVPEMQTTRYMRATLGLSDAVVNGACPAFSRRRRAWICSPDAVDVRRQLVGELGAAQLEDVLGVSLARAREVEAPEERGVIRDDDLRVHEVVHRRGRPRRRDLPAELAALEDAAKQRDLPLADAVRAPLPEDVVHLRVVDDTGHRSALLAHDLDERRKDRSGGQHRRGDA